MRTILHAYSFDTRIPSEKTAWRALEARLSKGPERHGPVFSPVYNSVQKLDGAEVTLKTKHLFGNQWNTAPAAGVSDKGLRVFDWALESVHQQPHIRRGHYLVQTDEMREIRRNTVACGYCGHQEAAQRGSVFCDRCLDSEYLKPSDVHLLRMHAVDDDSDRAPLTEAESAHIMPLYRSAQLHGNSERGRERTAKRRADIVAKRDRAIGNAHAEHDGILWLLDRGINTDNAIYYTHTGRFGFGWRNPLDAAAVSDLLAAMGGEFRFPYDIKRVGAPDLSGEG